MEHLIRNDWQQHPGGAAERACILRRERHPQGLDIDRMRFARAGELPLDAGRGRVVSFTRGTGVLHVEGGPLRVGPGVHVYLPADLRARLEAEPGTELTRVEAADPAQARGRSLLVRDERFLFACASEGVSLRWILTGQYVSRRVFLHHDEALLSRDGHPVSWFHTSMFDVEGLPKNADGESVFKMAYNSRTEINVCYDVAGDARVRMALHPYAPPELSNTQTWGPWHRLDSDANYHLDEALHSPETEWVVDPTTGARTPLRNKHEVAIFGGHVTLFCLFDPSPTGIEQHRPGEYSDYEPLEAVVARPSFAAHRRAIGAFDAMVDRLSLAFARGEESASPEDVALYREGHAAQCAVEQALHDALASEGKGRDRVLAQWMRPHALAL